MFFEEVVSQRKRKFGERVDVDVSKKFTYSVAIAEESETEPVVITKHCVEEYGRYHILDASVMIPHSIVKEDEVNKEIERLLKENKKDLDPDFEVTFDVDKVKYEESRYALPRTLYIEYKNRALDLAEFKKYKYKIYIVRSAYSKESNDVKFQKSKFEDWKKDMTFEKYQKIPKEYR